MRERVLLGLAKRDHQSKIEALRSVTEASAVALGVERVSIWRILPEATGIVCEDLFVLSANRHDQGVVLLARDYPRYFEALLESRTIPASNAHTDRRTYEFTADYLEPLGISSMMDVPIWHKGALYGVVCHEHVGQARQWTTDEMEFAGNLADLVALALEATERRSAESRWTTVMELIAEAVYILDPEGTILQMNQQGRLLMERLGGGLRLEERLRAVDYRDQLGGAIASEDMPTQRAMRGEACSELLTIWHHNGSFVGSFRITITPVHEDGQIRNLVAVLKDVTAEVRIDQLKAEFLSALAHELKTPITVVKGFTEILKHEPGIPSSVQSNLTTIDRASQRTERLIEDAVEMSGLMLGRLSLTRERVELRSLIQSVVGRLVPASPNHRIRVWAPEAVDVRLDRARIEQVIRRLLDNAVRYSIQGGDIGIRVEIEPQRVVVSVSDHGRGISLAHQRRIFEPFFRAGAAVGPGGLGIGLYLAREIVRLHGGDMWFESQEGLGSTFSFWIPREVVS